MTSGAHRHQRGNFTRELVEVAALSLAAGMTHLIVSGEGTPGTTTTLLLAAGAALLLVAGCHWALLRRGRRCARHTGRAETARTETARTEEDRQAEKLTTPAITTIPQQAMSARQTLWRLKASVSDSPGSLANLAGSLAGLGGDIRTMQVHPVADGAIDEVLLQLPGNRTAADLVAAVETAGGREVSVVRADVHELDDVPTRTANLATALVNGRIDLIHALRALLGGVEIRWQEEPATEGDAFTGGAMCLAEPGGGSLMLQRPGTGFTPAEFARAHAMAELATSCRDRVHPASRTARTSDGTELVLRPADRRDTELVAEFHERCSSAARHQRYFSPGPGSQRSLRRLLTPALGRSVLALGPAGEVVGMGNLMYHGEAGEVALLVRDDWQRKGIGRMLADSLVGQAAELGLTRLTARTQLDNTAIARTLRGAGMKLAGAPEPGEWSWKRDLRPVSG